MKYTFLAIAACVLFAACNGEATSETTNETAPATEMEAPVETAVVDPNAKIDPVCEMVKDDSWTEYSVSGTDTTWFCSETCKGAYDGNPAKYNKQG
jgi:YHS domain-containing protein